MSEAPKIDTTVEIQSPAPKSRGKYFKWWYVPIGVVGVIVIIILGFIVWALAPMHAEDQARIIVANNSNLTITENRQVITIERKLNASDTGLIFYPGARVEPAAYKYKLMGLAETGVRIYITKPPLNFAIFGINDASAIIRTHPEVKHWYIGGHSLGGAMACQYAKGNTDKLEGLVLLGSYCAADISGTDLRVLSLSGSQDGLSTPAKINANRHNLPSSAVMIEIGGQNHASFGNYGRQSGDNAATIDDYMAAAQIDEHLGTFFHPAP